MFGYILKYFMCLQGMEELEACHKHQQTAVTDDIKLEMASFQKKVLKETVSSGDHSMTSIA